MKHRNHYSRKKRNLAVLAERLQYLLTYHRDTATSQIKKLILRIKSLVSELTNVVSKPALAKILGATAFLFGISLTSQVSAQSFATPVANPFGLVSVTEWGAPAFADLDGDGDMDLLVGEYYGAIKYFENTGTSASPAFAAPQTNPFGLDSTYDFAFPTFADLDGDGDLDLLVGEYYGNFQYFENLETSPGFASLTQNIAVTLYPNPVQDVLTIAAKEKLEKIEVINSIGESIIIANNTNQISLSELAAGLYAVRITFEDGNYAIRKFVKQ